MNPVERAARRLDEWQQRSRPLAFLYAVIKKFGDDQAGDLAGLIAYFAFFSIFPLLLVMVAVLGFVLGSDSSVTAKALGSFPIVGEEIRKGSLRGSGLLLVVGIILALWSGLRVVQGMQKAMNVVWNVPLKRYPSFFLRLRRSVAALALIGVATVGTALLSGLGGGGALGTLGSLGGIVLSLVLNVALYLVAFRVLTDEALTWADVLPGAVVAGVLWTGLQALGGWYVDHQVQGASQTYGTFAVVIGLLSWLFLGAQASLLAAEINVVRARRLWPRSLVQPPLTPADRSALRTYGKQEERRPEEEVSVAFEDEGPPRPGVHSEGGEEREPDGLGSDSTPGDRTG